MCTTCPGAFGHGPEWASPGLSSNSPATTGSPIAEEPEASKTGRRSGGGGVMDLRFEVAVIPVSDVDRAKAFYEKLGWRLDADATAGDSFRIVQFTPPGSECSVQFGTNMTSAAPGS